MLNKSPEGQAIWEEFETFCEENELFDDRSDFLTANCHPSKELLLFPHELEMVEQTGEYHHECEISVVVRIGNHYFENTAFYNSWDSTEWGSEWPEVIPTEVMVTQYLPIKNV